MTTTSIAIAIAIVHEEEEDAVAVAEDGSDGDGWEVPGDAGGDGGGAPPLGSRDLCSKLLIPLNKCRQDTFYLPWKCEDQRHGYEKCEYDLFLHRMKKMQEERASQEGKQQQQLATQ